MNHEEFLELSAGHALHALTPDDEQRFVTAIAAHPEWADDADADLETAAALARAVVPVVPSPELRASILDRIDRDDATMDPVPPGRTPRRSMARRGWFALAASLIVLLVAGGVGTIVASHIPGTSISDTALLQIQRQPDARTATEHVAGGGTATVHWSDALGKAVLVSTGMPTIPSDKAFELWYVRGGTALPAGTFTAPGGDATSVLRGSLHAGDAIAVTVEADGGSRTGAPTSTPIVAIRTS